MRGSLRERAPGVWEVRVDIGRDPLSGRRLQLSRTVRGSKRKAQTALNALVSEADQGRHVGTDATFRDVAERWLRLSEADLSPTTLRRYRGLLDGHIFPAIGNRPAHRITTAELDDLYLGLIRTKKLAPATVRQIHAIVRRALSQAVRWGWIATNTAANTSPPRVSAPTITPPSIEDVQALIQFADDYYPEFGRFLHLAVATGARRGELCAIRYSSIDTAARTLTIGRSIIDLKGGVLEKDTKTHAIRRIALDDHSLAVFAAHRREMEAMAEQADTRITDRSYVFSSDPAGLTPWQPNYATRTFEALRRQLGITNTRLHDLRHFAATQLLSARVPVRTVAGRLGHANASTTLSVYAHFLAESDREAADVMGTILNHTGTTPTTTRSESA